MLASPHLDLEEFRKVSASVGLTSDTITTPGAMIPFSAEVGLIEALGRRSGDPLLPFKLGLTCKIRSGSFLTCLLFASPTLGAALENLRDFTQIAYPCGTAVLRRKNNGYDFGLLNPGPELILTHSYPKFLLGRTLSVFRAATRVPFHLQAVRLPASEETCRQLSHALGCPVRQDEKHMVISMSEEAFRLPIRTHQKCVLNHLKNYGSVLLEQQNTKPKSMREKVLHEMFSRQHDQLPRLTDIAKILALSERTLSRRLSEEGLNFQDIVDDARKRSAKALMENTELSLTEISYRLGFADQSSFTRAFRRWSGSSPIEARTNIKIGSTT
ncbi:MAG: helix-turn-helix domain-containing protein [Aliishimia sp.]